MQKFILPTALFLSFAIPFTAAGAADAPAPAATAPTKTAALKTALEGLWVGHVNAVRKVVVAEIA